MAKIDMDKVKSWLASGFNEPVVEDEFVELRNAFLTGIQGHFNYQIFGDTKPAYVICEVENKKGLRLLPNTIESEGFGPISSENVLLPVAPETPAEVTSDGSSVSISFSLSSEIELAKFLIDQKTSPEFDLFLRDNSPDDQLAFQFIADGQWFANEIRVDGNSEFIFPRLGFRPYSKSYPAEYSPYLNRVYDQYEHLIANRFLRFPLTCVASVTDSKSISFRVQMGDNADFVAEQLKAKLFLNHVGFWNKRTHVARGGGDFLDARKGDSNLVVLRHPTNGNVNANDITVLHCVDRKNGQAYVQSRWIATDCHGLTFHPEIINRSGEKIALRFTQSMADKAKDLDIRYMVRKNASPPDSFSVMGLKTGYTETVKIGGDAEEWKSNMLAPLARLVSREDIRSSLKMLMPHALKTKGVGEKFSSGAVRINSELRRLPHRMTGGGKTHRAVQTAVIRIPLASPIIGDIGRHYTELWEHRIEERCSAGTIVVIEWELLQ